MDGSDLTDDEASFLHMLISRDHGRAKARSSEPSARVRTLQAKGLVDLVHDDAAMFIVVTETGMDVMSQPQRAGSQRR